MSERGPDGRWLPGHSGNEGNKNNTYKDRMLAVVKDTVTAENWVAITNRAVALATSGDNNARKWLSEYLLGRPVEIDGEPFALPDDYLEWLADKRLEGLNDQGTELSERTGQE